MLQSGLLVLIGSYAKSWPRNIEITSIPFQLPTSMLNALSKKQRRCQCFIPLYNRFKKIGLLCTAEQYFHGTLT